MKKTNVIILSILCIISLLLLSCNLNGDKYLGANYWFWEDGNQSEIVYGNESTAQGSYGIIDANVSQYAFNDKYIIAKTNWLKKNGMEAYWIIDKQIKINKDTFLKAEAYDCELKKGVTGPLSLTEFENKKKSLDIALEFK